MDFYSSNTHPHSNHGYIEKEREKSVHNRNDGGTRRLLGFMGIVGDSREMPCNELISLYA